jgi:hypothetical protein
MVRLLSVVCCWTVASKSSTMIASKGSLGENASKVRRSCAMRNSGRCCARNEFVVPKRVSDRKKAREAALRNRNGVIEPKAISQRCDHRAGRNM